MKHIKSIGGKRILVILVNLFILGCVTQSPPVEFYKLSSLPRPQATAEPTNLDQALAIGVGPVRFPEYLDRPQIVTRTGPNRLNVDEFHRWGSSLRAHFSRALTENISILLRTNRVAAFPWPTYFEPTLHIIMDVQDFVATPEEGVVLSARWAIVEPNRKSALSVRQSVISKPLVSNDFEAQVAVQSDALETLSREIVEELKKLGKETKSARQ